MDTSWIKPGVKVQRKRDSDGWYEVLSVSEQSAWLLPLPGGIEQSLSLSEVAEEFEPVQ